jgi:hypothetical protein
MSRFRSRLACLLRFHDDALDQIFALFQTRGLSRSTAVFERGSRVFRRQWRHFNVMAQFLALF